MSKRYEIRFHSFYMRWEVVSPRGKVVAMFISEDAASHEAFKLNYPREESE